MNTNLYFLAPIAEAFQQRNVTEALVRSFHKILSLGHTPEYRQGIAQFAAFMREVNCRIEEASSRAEYTDNEGEIPFTRGIENDSSSSEIMTVDSSEAGELPDDTMQERRLREAYGELYPSRPAGLGQLLLKRDNEVLAQFEITGPPATFRVDQVAPGSYSLHLATGRTLWTDRLTEKDLLWHRMHPRQPIRLAAQSGDLRDTFPSRTITLLSGEIEIAVFAGLDAGRIRIRIVGPDSPGRDDGT